MKCYQESLVCTPDYIGNAQISMKYKIKNMTSVRG